MGTLIFKLPLLIFDDAMIKLLIDLKNLEENLIAIEIDKNNKNLQLLQNQLDIEKFFYQDT